MNFRMFPLMAEGDGGGDGGKPPKSGFTPEYVHDLREENRSWRLKHAESETARKADAEARKTAEDAVKASEKTTADKVQEVQSAADQRVIRAELKAAALKAGMVDLDGLKLADLSKVKLNAEGEVEGADELMEAMKKTKPYLFADPSSSHTGRPPPKGEQKPKLATEMTDAEYEAAKKVAIKR